MKSQHMHLPIMSTLPNTPICITVAIVWIILKLRSAIKGNVGRCNKVNREQIAGDRPVSQQTIQFVDELPAMEIERLSHSRSLKSAGLYAQKSRRTTIAGGHHVDRGIRKSPFGQL